MSGQIVNWNDVEGKRVTVGPLDATWTNLGEAAGTQRLGLRRIVVEPGKRSTPAHVHSGEEEIFVVLAGSGLSWQGGATCEVAAGDLIVHLVDGPPHTLIAGHDGLDVLAFGERAVSESAYLPRANVAWVGGTWVKAGIGDHPFVQEVAAGELPLPAPTDRPPSVVAMGAVAGTEVAEGGSIFTRRDVSAAAGAVRTAMRHISQAPGKLGYPPHAHSGAEEIFVVLAGGGDFLYQVEGTQSWEAGATAVKSGDVVSAPAGSGRAHAFRAGPDGLTLLAYGNRDSNSVAWYPRSKKLSFGGLKVVGRFEPCGYWNGER